jgi:FkbM family methyltransferase
VKLFLKKLFRTFFKAKYIVPFKYYYSKIRGHLEPEIGLLPYILSGTGRVIDVGANQGMYSYPLSNMCTHLEVFEPNPYCSDILISWAQAVSNVNVYPVALSDVEGVASLRVPVDSSGIEHDASASLEILQSGQFSEYLVKSETLDSFEFKNVALIKIDVEGHEHRVIQGARHTISIERPALLIEIEQRHHVRPISEVFSQIMSLDYDGFYLLDQVLCPLDKFDSSKHQLISNLGGSHGRYINNFLFLHRARLVAGDYDLLLS